MGEMYFYLAMCDRAFVGGGFRPTASHNIIEPLAMGKPVGVGPNISTIEYPGVEALDAGVAAQVHDHDGLVKFFLGQHQPAPDAITQFLTQHAGAVDKTLAAIDRFTSH